MEETSILKLDRLVYGGEAVGRMEDGRAVFVPFAMPGEKVRIKLIEEKPRYARAEVIEVLEPSPQRVVPRCRHFMVCGGCHYQHMIYSAQLEAKKSILREQLERMGGVKDIPPVSVLASQEAWNYRNHVQFHLTKDGKLGFRRAHSNQTFAIQECHLPEATINHIWPRVEVEPIPGLERISMRSGMDGDILLVLESTDTEPVDINIEGLPVSVIHQSPAGSLILAGSDYISMEVAGRRFHVSAPSFFQVNNCLLSLMVEHLLALLPWQENMTVLDCYCGVGLFSAFLAAKVKQLVGIELSPEACVDFTTNLNEYDQVSLYEAPVEAVLSSIEFHPDVILVDPPREGLGGNTLKGLIAQKAAHLVYVSCDPSTLARDARQLVASGYAVQQLSLVDMFPQTYHLESISYWRKS